MATISIGSIAASEFLSRSEKIYSSLITGAKTLGSIGLCYAGIEGGMAVGAIGGPIGIAVGGVVGGLISGISSNLLCRFVD